MKGTYTSLLTEHTVPNIDSTAIHLRGRWS